MIKTYFFSFLIFISKIALSQWTTNGTHIYNSNSGNVGIGTTSPLNKLDVTGNLSLSSGGSNVLRLLQNISAGGYTGPGTYSESDMGFGVSSGNKFVWIGKDANTELMRLDAEGNFGIGTSAPSAKLSVSGTGGELLRITGNGDANSWLSFWNSSSEQARYAWNSDIGTYICDRTNLGTNIINSSGTITAYFKNNGNVGIGTTTPSEKLSVNGNISAKKIIVTQTGWSDYVFNSSYKLRPLSELSKYIKQKEHLPEVPSAKEIEANGINVGDNQALLLKKIEELTLYIIGQQNQIDELRQQIHRK